MFDLVLRSKSDDHHDDGCIRVIKHHRHLYAGHIDRLLAAVSIYIRALGSLINGNDIPLQRISCHGSKVPAILRTANSSTPYILSNHIVSMKYVSPYLCSSCSRKSRFTKIRSCNQSSTATATCRFDCSMKASRFGRGAIDADWLGLVWSLRWTDQGGVADMCLRKLCQLECW